MFGNFFRKLIFTVLNLLWIWQQIHAVLFLITIGMSLHSTIRWCNSYRHYEPSTDTFESCSPAHFLFRKDPRHLPLLLVMGLETIEFTSALQWAGWKRKMLHVDLWTLLLVEGSKIAVWIQYLDRVALMAEGARENWINQTKLVMEHEAAFDLRFHEIEQFSPSISCDAVMPLLPVVQGLVENKDIAALMGLILDGPLRAELVKNESMWADEGHTRPPPEPPLVNFALLGFDNSTSTTLAGLGYDHRRYHYGDITGYRERHVGLPYPTDKDYWYTLFIA